MRSAATICFVLAGLFAVGSLRSLTDRAPEGQYDESFWIGHYTAIFGLPLIPLALGLGLRRAAKRRERRQATGSNTAPAMAIRPRKWSAIGAFITALCVIGTAAAFPREGEEWAAINVVGVVIGVCFTLGSAYMAVRPKRNQ